MVKIIKNFGEFFREFKVVSFAIAFIIGTAMSDLVKSFVADILMPFIDPLIPEGTWQTAVLTFGPFTIKWGLFLGAVLNFLLLAFIIYLVVKKLLKYKPRN